MDELVALKEEIERYKIALTHIPSPEKRSEDDEIASRIYTGHLTSRVEELACRTQEMRDT